ncbi:MAG: ribonuclease HII [Planctomycetota bacterium]|jgi:ribonuclease HII
MKVVIGVDEVGFGAIAGPFVVAAVAFATSTRRPVLKRVKRSDVPVKDSKRINKKVLPLFEELVKRECAQYEIVARAAWEVDREGAGSIRETTMIAAVKRLLERLAFQHPDVYDDYRVVIDGELNLGAAPFKYRAQAQADDNVWQVSCASILAKTYQVRAMQELHVAHDVYGWNRNNGYGTADHLAALKRHGVTRYHRRTYKAVRELL